MMHDDHEKMDDAPDGWKSPSNEEWERARGQEYARIRKIIEHLNAGIEQGTHIEDPVVYSATSADVYNYLKLIQFNLVVLSQNAIGALESNLIRIRSLEAKIDAISKKLDDVIGSSSILTACDDPEIHDPLIKG